MNLEKYFNFEEKFNIGISGLTNQLISFYVLNEFKKQKNDFLIITNSLYESNILYSSLSKLTKDVYLFPMDDFLTSESIAISPELLSIRLNTLNNIILQKNKIVITNLMGLLRFLPLKKIYEDSILKINKETALSKQTITSKLVSLGYKKENVVSTTGEFASRGFILDIFPMNTESPVRIEYWGDEIESIKLFDAESQRSKEEISDIEITPFTEFITEKKVDIESNQKNLPLVSNKVSNIYEYLNEPVVFFKDYNQILAGNEILNKEIFEYSLTKEEKVKKYMNDFLDYNFKKVIYLMTVDNLIKDVKLKKIYNFSSKSISSFNSNTSLINDYIQNKINIGKTIVISLPKKEMINSIKKFLNFNINEVKNEVIVQNKINVIFENYDEGFEFDNLILLTPSELFGKKVRPNIRPKLKIGSKIKEMSSLSVGDYVVHLDHGIGIYNGIKTLTKRGNKKDYLEIKYAGNDKLYIPVEKIELINKYSAKEGIAPKINKLSGTEWQKKKLRVKNKIKNIAGDLLKISAKRATEKGFSFKKDDELQMDFESEFEYELTKDQKISLDKIKKLMEKSNPMDVLLCGDVGYGKTEVAFRAIFKAVISKKQVAYLCPTTILSSQHYNNAINRFKAFGINISLINRFTSKKDLKITLEKLKNGKIDILFGTHRILSDDIKFKDLGLLVIDEEQRFGVMHKEKIKKLKSSIDVLTLSATPIPRTLQMSLVGIRELALIETPPAARYPIQTYVIEESNQLIKEAIYKELSRNGQVFILYNNIKGIEEKMHDIQTLVPEAKVTIAHGQMNKNMIENRMLKFINYEYDILLCTTIIETGIDIPNVNTLIIFDSDRFGLSQLYQIRGRVGRSNKIAYSYLLYQKNKMLNEVAIKRLNAIKEFTELGSGFSIAMRDLSIRGAGDILGSEQAGFIDDVGYDLYLKLLNEEVEALKGNKNKEEAKESENNLIDVSTHIDDKYIDSDILKIEIHKLINEINSLEKLNSVKEEIKDRFGHISEELEIYMYNEWFENMAKNLNITKVKENNLFIEIVLEETLVNKIDISSLFMKISDISTNFKLESKNNSLYVKLYLMNLKKHHIYYLTEFLNVITQMIV